MNLKSPQSSLDGCGFPSLFVGVVFFPTPTVQVTTLPAFQGVMDRLQEVISQELNGFPIILAMPKPAVFDLPFTCQTMKHATTCHHLPKHHPHISSHSRQRPLSTPQRRWDGLAPGKTHAWCTHTKRGWLFQESEVGDQPTSYQTRILPRTLRNHFLEEHACLIQTLVAQRRRSLQFPTTSFVSGAYLHGIVQHQAISEECPTQCLCHKDFEPLEKHSVSPRHEGLVPHYQWPSKK